MIEPQKVWIPFHYFGYWDVPRLFVLRRGSEMLRFESAFDEALDDYSPNYLVSSLPIERYVAGDPRSAVSREHPWMDLGEVPVASLEFDPSRRSCVSLESLTQHPVLKIPPLPGSSVP